jgi:hypothetical protein
MTPDTNYSTFWTRVLAEKGLESPGREEAVKDTLERIKMKKELKEQRQQEKKKRGRKRK